MARVHKRVSLETILKEIKQTCPAELHEDIGKFIGSGLYGETYEVDGGAKILKVSIAKTEEAAEQFLDKLKAIQSMDSSVFAEVFDFGILCPIQVPETSKYMVKTGTAYFYVMERLKPINPSEAKIAVRTIHDLREMNVADRKKYFFVKAREYKREGDIEEGGPNPLQKGADLFNRMEAAKVSHRDIHPGNIMQNQDGVYKLVDLESAQLLQGK